MSNIDTIGLKETALQSIKKAIGDLYDIMSILNELHNDAQKEQEKIDYMSDEEYDRFYDNIQELDIDEGSLDDATKCVKDAIDELEHIKLS